MIQPIEFWVSGIPKPAGSKRAFAIKRGGQYTGRTVVMDACKGSKDWKHDVKLSAQEAYHGEPLSFALSVICTFYMPRPKGHFRTNGQLKDSATEHPLSKPDTTKLFRGVEDAMTGIIWRDDAQIVAQRIFKTYADGRGPGCLVRISEL